MIGTTNNISNIVGFVASVISILLGSIYLTAIVVSILKEGLAFPPAKPIQFVGAIVSIGIGIDLIVLMVALKPHIIGDRQFLIDISIIFMALFCGATSINRYVQLAILPQYSDTENPEIIQLIHPYGSKSIMFAIESLGWGLFYGLAALFAGFAFFGGGLGLWIGLLFIIGGVLSITYAVGVVIRQPIMSMLGFPAWGILLPVASTLLAIEFWKML
jgi:hypothetical protein